MNPQSFGLVASGGFITLPFYSILWQIVIQTVLIPPSARLASGGSIRKSGFYSSKLIGMKK